MPEEIDYDRLREALNRRNSGQSRRTAPRAGADPEKAAEVRAAMLGDSSSGGGGDAPSLMEQVSAEVMDAGKGLLFDLPPILWDSTVGNVGAAVASPMGLRPDDIRERGGVLGPIQRTLINESAVEEFAKSDRPFTEVDGSQGLDKARAAQPVPTVLGEIAAKEAPDLAELGVSLAPGGLKPSETEWGKAEEEGRIVRKFVDTLGSATLGARIGLGGASSIARSAGRPMPRVERAASAARAADDAVDAAILIAPRLAGRYIAGPAARAAARTAPAQRLNQSGLANYTRSRLVGRAARPVRDENTIGERAVGTRGQAEAVGPAVRSQRILTAKDRPRGERPDRPHEMVADMDAVANLDAITRATPGMEARLGLDRLAELDEMNPKAFDDFVEQVVSPRFDGDLTPAGARMFVDYRLGRLADDVATDITRASDNIRDARKQRDYADISGERVPIGQQAFLDARGRLESDTAGIRRFNEQSLRAEPLPQSAERVRAEAEPRLSALQEEVGTARRTMDERAVDPNASDAQVRAAAREAATARGRLSQAEADVQRRIAEANEALDAAPAQWRPVVDLTRSLVEGAENFDWGEYNVPQRWVDEFKASTATTVAELIRTTDPVYAPGTRQAGTVGGPSPTGQRARKATSAHQKQTGRVPLHSDKQAALILADIRQQELNQTMLRVRDRMGNKATDFDIPEGASGPEILAIASEQMGGIPVVAWDPTRVFATDATGQILVDSDGQRIRNKGGSQTPPAQVTPDAVIVPKWVADSYDYAVSRQSELAQIFIDKPTRIFKGSVLALSGRWQLGNAISGAIMLAANGVPITDVISYSREAWSELRKFRRGETTRLPRWLLDSNLSAQELKTLRNVAEAVENIDFDEYTIRRPKSRLLRAGGDVVRAGYEVNTFVDNFYKSIGYMKWVDEGVDSSTAVQRALDTLGDYDRMTPFERRVVRRVLPFWAWTRHITQLTARLATDHPARTAFNLHLAGMFDPDEALLDKAPWLQGAARVGEEWLTIGWMFPFGDTASMDFTDPAAMLTENLNPTFGTYSSVLFGVEPSFDRIDPLYRPDAPYGQTGGSPLRHRPQSVPYLVGRNIPQFRAFYDELQRHRSGGEGARLYDTGERTGQPDPNRRLEDNIARLLGVPFPKTYDT